MEEEEEKKECDEEIEGATGGLDEEVKAEQIVLEIREESQVSSTTPEPVQSGASLTKSTEAAPDKPGLKRVCQLQIIIYICF